jgi:hypothetical protein
MAYKVEDYMDLSFPVTSFETPIREVARMISDEIHDIVVVMGGNPEGLRLCN